MKTIYFGGNGAAWCHHVGYMEYIKKHYNFNCPITYAGVSSGSIIATIYGLYLNPKRTMEIYKIIHQASIDPELGYNGYFHKCIYPFLFTAFSETLIDISEMRHIYIRVTNTRLQTWFINEFEDLEDLVQTIVASIHIPYFVTGKFSHQHRDYNFIDGYYVSNFNKIGNNDHYIIESLTSPSESVSYKNDNDLKDLFIRGYLHAHKDRDKLDIFFGEPKVYHDKLAEEEYSNIFD